MGKDRKTRLIKLTDFLKQANVQIVGGLGLGGGIRTLYRHLSILYSKERALKSSDLWLKEKISDGTLSARNRFTNNIVNIPLHSVVPSLRRPSGVECLDVTEKSDFLVTETFSCIGDFFEDKKIMQKFESNKKCWNDYIKRRQGSVFIARKFDLSAPGTRLISFYSSVSLVPGEFWLLRNLNSEFSKVLSIWFNSTPNLIQMFLNRTETRGAWMKTDIDALKEMYVIDPRIIGRKENNELLEIFDSIATVPLPCITEQLQKVHPTRKKIDETILKIVGFNESEIDNILTTAYPALCNEIDKLKTLMEG